MGCLAGVVTGESEVSLPEGPALEDEVDFLSRIDFSQGYTINFREFVALAPLLPLGVLFFVVFVSCYSPFLDLSSADLGSG